MTTNRADKVQQKSALQRQTGLNRRELEETPLRKNLQQASIIDLQRLVGNKGVQSLLAKGKLGGLAAVQAQRATAQHSAIQRSAAQSIQRCEDCGDEHEEISSNATTVQRFWGDDDEGNENQSESSGGGIWDTVSDAASAAADTASNLVSDTANQAADTVGEIVNWARDTTNGVIDGAIGAAKGVFGDEAGQQTNEAASPTEVTGSGDSVTSGDANCETEEGIGYGSGTGVSVSLHGKTDANYDHGKPYPKTFPSGATVKRYAIGKVKVFDASGTVDATFKANPKISLPSVPSGLSPCQTKAVQEFINGDLDAHEHDHANAFSNNYDGTVSVPFSFKAIPESKEAEAIQSAIETEDVKRINTANTASGKLDPWKKTIPGLDCEDE